MKNIVSDLVDWLSHRALSPGDNEDLRWRKKVLVVGLSASFGVSLLWCVSYWALHLWATACVGLFACLLDLGLLMALYTTKRYQGILWIHIGQNLLLPFVAQAVMGGIVNSGALGLWAVVGPLTALVHELPFAWIWFLAFLGLEFGATVSESYWVAHALDNASGWASMFLVSNLTGVLSILYFPLEYVSLLRRRLEEKVKGQSMQIAMEHAKTERLLLNILPAEIAKQLKDEKGMISESYPDASVLFADIAGFTRYSSQLPARQLVEMLNNVFSLFDALAEEYGLEKIKTIGDAYMVVGNVPAKMVDHLAIMAEMALAMQTMFQGHVKANPGMDLGLRIGIHCGPAVAGVIGFKKFSYDLWGDTVNIASRMESHGESGRVHVSEAVYQRLKSHYMFEDRGSIDLRGRGQMKTYWLLQRRPEVAPLLSIALPEFI